MADDEENAFSDNPNWGEVTQPKPKPVPVKKSYLERFDKEMGQKVEKKIREWGKVKNPNIDPLKGVKKSVGGKRGRGRPRKYARTSASSRPVGRPEQTSVDIGRQSVMKGEGMMRQVIPQALPRKEYVPPTQPQSMMLKFLGNKQQTWGFGGNPVMLNQQLNRGNGIIKSGDEGVTASMFGIGRRRRS